MKKIIFATLLMVFLSNFYSAQEKMSIQNAIETAEKENKPVLLEFFADWCSTCKKFEKKTLTDDSVQKIVKENYIFLKIDAEKMEPDFVKQQNIKSYPQFFILNKKGSIVKKEKGMMNVSEFTKFISQKK